MIIPAKTSIGEVRARLADYGETILEAVVDEVVSGLDPDELLAAAWVGAQLLARELMVN